VVAGIVHQRLDAYPVEKQGPILYHSATGVPEFLIQAIAERQVLREFPGI
jgi:hypothetical protein